MSSPNEATSPGDSDAPAKRSPQEKFVLVWEAVKRSLLSAEILLRNTYAELDGIARDVDAGKVMEDRAPAPLISCVGFIDFAYRFKSLMDSLPLVNKKHVDLVRVQKALESVEKARHHVQHLRGELSANEPVEYPILGSLSWVAGDVVYTMALGTPIGNASFVSISYDKENSKYTAKHLFAARNAVVDLDAVIEEMRAAYNSVAGALEAPQADPQELKALKELKWGATLVMKMEFRRLDSAATPSQAVPGGQQ